MVGQARTVVRGTDIVTFPVTVIDVQQTSDAPGGALVLVRAEGPLIEGTGGVAEGMSGSPVYVTGADGVSRVMGAVAYGSGDQANVIVGVTPIEQMIDSSSGQRANAAPPFDAGRRSRCGWSATAPRPRGGAARPGAPGALPARAVDDRRRVPPAGGRALGRARALRRAPHLHRPAHIRPAVPLVPGASLTALLAGGDLVLGAVGTVTYVDGPTVLGFGHPFTGGARPSS